MNTNFEKLCLAMDWNLLHEQKLDLLSYDGQFDGVIGLIDSLQDESDRLGLWKFPDDKD